MISKAQFVDEFARSAARAGIRETCKISFFDGDGELALDVDGLDFDFSTEILEMPPAIRASCIHHAIGHSLCPDDSWGARDAAANVFGPGEFIGECLAGCDVSSDMSNSVSNPPRRMTNRYAQACESCGVQVPAGKGTLLPDPWRVFCAGCMPEEEAPPADPPKILATLNRGKVEFKLGGDRAPRDVWEEYRRACTPCKASKRGSEWINSIPLEDAGPVLDAMSGIEGLLFVADDEIVAALRHRASDVEDRRAAAQERLEAVDRILRERGHSLYNYQRHGVEWLASQDSALLADDMGLGKTIQALVAAPEGSPILVVCPAVAKGVWVREAERWRPDLEPVLLSGRGSFQWPRSGEMVVINYDILPKSAGPAPEGVVVIADEAHAIKNAKAQRTQKFRDIADAARAAGGVVWLLTATPLLGKPPELWSLLVAMDRIPFSGFKQFAYMMGGEQGQWGWEWTGTPEPEVAERLRPLMLRRMKTEVLTDLPAKRYETLEVPFKGKKRELDAAIKKWDTLGKPNQLPPFEALSNARATLAEAKIPALISLVEEYEEAEEPIVVFSAYRAPIDTLGMREGWATITGDTPPDERARIEAAFQRGELKGVAATIQAGGVAITLTRASNAIFNDLDWTPALNRQAEDRIYRIGQDRGVLITTLVADHALDRRLATVLQNKQEIIDASVDEARRGGDESVGAGEAAELDALAARIEEDMAGITEELTRAAEERQRREERAIELGRARRAQEGERERQRAERQWQDQIRGSVRRRKGLAEEIEDTGDDTLRPAQTNVEAWVENALIALDEMNFDYGKYKNYAGYNKADGKIGKMLAMRAGTTGLSDLEWQFAIAMVRKYWRQVGKAPEVVIPIAPEEPEGGDDLPPMGQLSLFKNPYSVSSMHGH
jgi:superfamily II DNA or RNA helicase